MRVLIYGLTLNALALAAIVLLLLLSFAGSYFQWDLGSGNLIAGGAWAMFTLGSLLCMLGSPKGSRLVSTILFALAAMALFIFSLGKSQENGVVFAFLALLLYCPYQEALSKALSDPSLLALVKRAYDRPLRLFLVGILLFFVYNLNGGQPEFLQPLLIIIALGCPMWGFAYLGVVTVHLVKAVLAQDKGESASISTGY